MTVVTNLKQYTLLERALEEKQFWEELMCLWRHCEDTLGVDVRQRVRTFTYRLEFLTPEQVCQSAIQYGPLTHHNAVRLDDDSVVPMPIHPIPVMPGWMNVDLKAKI